MWSAFLIPGSVSFGFIHSRRRSYYLFFNYLYGGVLCTWKTPRNHTSLWK